MAKALPAVEGGTPVRKDFLPFALPLIGEEEIEAVTQVLRSGWLTAGPKTLEFEAAFREYTGAAEAVAVNSCTAALHLSLVALGIGPGDEVITTPFTFAATANVVVHCGARPVFVDIEEATFNIDPAKIEAAITPRTRAIIPVHYAGLPCRMDAIFEIAQKHGLHVVEDAAHAAGAEYRGHRIGSLPSRTACFSFYPTKNMTTGEGGMITTGDVGLAEHMRQLRLHGISRDAWKRYDKTGSWYYEVEHPGFKYNTTDIQAALGVVQLRKLDGFIQTRQEYADYLSQALSELSGLGLPPSGDGARHARHLYPVRLPVEEMAVDRAGFMKALAAENIGASVHFIPLHLHSYYQRAFGYRRGDFPVAERVYEGVLSLPLYPKMTRVDLDSVVEAMTKLWEHYYRG